MNGHAVRTASHPFTELLAASPLGPDVEVTATSGPSSTSAEPPPPVVSSGGGGSAPLYMPMPHLMGAPAYARPPRIVAETPRPLDPDDLPIEAMRSPEDEALLSGTYQPLDDDTPTIKPSSQGGLRAVASRLFGSRV
ncbi:MAG: hypothetical protein ABWY52_08525 [Candidatus Limnocylindrales bacterium]